MGELDQVSQAIGELKGLIVGHGLELKQIKTQVSDISKTQRDMSIDGCAKGTANEHRLQALEDVEKIESIGTKKLMAIMTGISGAIVGIVEAIRRAHS